MRKTSKFVILVFIFILSLSFKTNAQARAYYTDVFNLAGVPTAQSYYDDSSKEFTPINTNKYYPVLFSSDLKSVKDISVIISRKVFIICDTKYALEHSACDYFKVTGENIVTSGKFNLASLNISGKDIFLIPQYSFVSVPLREDLISYFSQYEHPKKFEPLKDTTTDTTSSLINVFKVVLVLSFISLGIFIVLSKKDIILILLNKSLKYVKSSSSFLLELNVYITLGLFIVLSLFFGYSAFVKNTLLMFSAVSAFAFLLSLSKPLKRIFPGLILLPVIAFILSMFVPRYFVHQPSEIYSTLVSDHFSGILPLKYEVRPYQRFYPFYIRPDYRVFINDYLIYDPVAVSVKNVPLSDLKAQRKDTIVVSTTDTSRYIETLLKFPDFQSYAETNSTSKYFVVRAPNSKIFKADFSCTEKSKAVPVTFVKYTPSGSQSIKIFYFQGCETENDKFSQTFVLDIPYTSEDILEIQNYKDLPLTKISSPDKIQFLKDPLNYKVLFDGTDRSTTQILVANFGSSSYTFTKNTDVPFTNISEIINDFIKSKVIKKNFDIWSDTPGVVFSTKL